MPTPGMIALRPVNLRIGNLSRHSVIEVRLVERTLLLHFSEMGRPFLDFNLQLEGVVALVDRGVTLRPLTAGIVWTPPTPFGCDLAARSGSETAQLIELRLDFENSGGLISRFRAIAESICVVPSLDHDAFQDQPLLASAAGA